MRWLLVLASMVALSLVDCESQAESGDWAWGKGRDRISGAKATGRKAMLQ